MPATVTTMMNYCRCHGVAGAANAVDGAAVGAASQMHPIGRTHSASCWFGALVLWCGLLMVEKGVLMDLGCVCEFGCEMISVVECVGVSGWCGKKILGLG